MISKRLFRALAYAKYILTSWNTGGEGIHSPYLFYIVRMLFNDACSYYCWERIEERRQAMLYAPKLVHKEDFGTGTTCDTLVSKIAARELEKKRNSQLFFRLIAFLGKEKGAPLEIVELGTSLGITTAYLAMADTRNRVFTYEGSTEVLAVAQQNWKKLGIENVHPIEGNINDTLYSNAREKEIDFAFLDANHTCEATWRYFCELARFAHEKSIFIVDDIHYSQDMEKAWRQIKESDKVATTMDCFDFGIVFFDTHYIKKHYILRL